MIINIIYKSDHCIAGIPSQWGHLLISFGAHRYSWDDRLSVYCCDGLCLCIICRISEFDVRLSSKAWISIIILLLVFRCVFILNVVSGIVIRILSFCCGCCIFWASFSNGCDLSIENCFQRKGGFDLSC